MKSIKRILLLALVVILTTGCSLKKDTLVNSTIYTTIYPIEYLTEFLYSDYATIESIYPKGADINTYELTDKQLSNYAKGNLFIYNGLSEEKNITKNLINKNKNLLIIDVSNGLSYNNALEELWMSPNNYLMLAKNIKDNLIEYLANSLIIDSINNKYNELAEILSLKDADLRSIGKQAVSNGKNTLVVSSNALKFLESYGFNIISLDEDTLTESSYNAIKNNFSKKVYTSILVLDNNYTEHINNIINEHQASAINISSMTNKSENQNDNYLDNIQSIIDSIRGITLN